MLEQLTIFSFAFVFYAYFGYPLILSGFLALKGKKQKNRYSESKQYSLTIIIACYNEIKFIREKLENTLKQTYFGKSLAEVPVQIIVASDCSNDGTDELVQEYAKRKVQLISLAQRSGKEHAQKAALKIANGEIIIFSDAKIMLENSAIDNFVKYFSDPKVGAVSSVDRIISGSGESSGEGFYVKYEMFLRSLESKFNSLVGLSGSGFAVRKELTRNLRVDLPSDFSLLIAAIKNGYRGVHAPDVIGNYQAVATEEAEFHRKVRTILRGLDTFFKSTELLNPFKFGLFSWQIFSHKLCRWLVPFFWISGSIGAILLCFSCEPFFVILGYSMVYFLLFAYLAFRIRMLRKLVFFKIPLFFIVVNLSILLAWYQYFLGKRVELWEPSDKGSES